MKSLVPPLMAALVALSPISNPPVSLGQAIDIQRGATLFGRSCIGCHDGGGNIIQPGATLFLKDLQRNEVDTEEEIFRVTYYGKGRMPGFGENCTPRGQCTFGARLQEEEIKLLAEFVKSQAEQDELVSIKIRISDCRKSSCIPGNENAIRASVHPEDLTVIMMPLDKLYG
ncbi:hypothetical protein LOK49_LG09G02620 [Camellia lanceoleosa]|uniref:Uncharacterized protein n=1 Tax=Camellia lanceoleosa TaxID=1840588 RepID=A0ACC0GDP0_9ERIC|nr:hypothetical protein LOK49_LG09G02620 [Camellia lanceoleosa]